MSRLRSTDEFASLDSGDLSEVAIEACRLAVTASGLEDRSALGALRLVEEGQADVAASASLHQLATELDQAAFDAQEDGDDSRYDSLFRQSRAASALAFALSQEPDESIYEAAFAVGTPDELMRRLAT